jgi:hypothetical protein
MPTLTQTATPHTTGPLYLSNRCVIARVLDPICLNITLNTLEIKNRFKPKQLHKKQTDRTLTIS